MLGIDRNKRIMWTFAPSFFWHRGTCQAPNLLKIFQTSTHIDWFSSVCGPSTHSYLTSLMNKTKVKYRIGQSQILGKTETIQGRLRRRREEIKFKQDSLQRLSLCVRCKPSGVSEEKARENQKLYIKGLEGMSRTFFFIEVFLKTRRGVSVSSDTGEGISASFLRTSNITIVTVSNYISWDSFHFICPGMYPFAS